MPRMGRVVADGKQINLSPLFPAFNPFAVGLATGLASRNPILGASVAVGGEVANIVGLALEAGNGCKCKTK